jgi:hypothetical protein
VGNPRLYNTGALIASNSAKAASLLALGGTAEQAAEKV